jgi:hypothetical protein
MEADASGGWHGMKYQVTDYVIDTALYRISRAGDAIPVEPKVFDLLVYLIRHRDRVLARDELFQEVWNGREVSDGTLSNHIKSARKVSAIAASCRKPSSPSVAAAISSLRRSRKSRLARGSLRKMRRPLRQRCAPSVNLPRLLGACPWAWAPSCLPLC